MSRALREITDKDLIVFLVSSGVPIKDIKKDEGANRSIVYFEDTDQLQQAILNFVNRSVEVNVADYIAAEKRIKTLLHAQKL